MARLLRSIIIAFGLTIVTLGVWHQSKRPTPIRLALQACSYYLAYLSQPNTSELFSAPECIEGKRALLTKLSRSHFNRFYTLLKNPEIVQPLFARGNGYSPRINPSFYLYYQLLSQSVGTRVVYTVTDKESGKISGMIELIHPDHDVDSHVAGWADPKVWGTGISAETLNLAKNVFFSLFPDRLLNVFVAPQNTRSQLFLTKCGFQFKNICSTPGIAKDCYKFVLENPQKAAPELDKEKKVC